MSSKRPVRNDDDDEDGLDDSDADDDDSEELSDSAQKQQKPKKKKRKKSSMIDDAAEESGSDGEDDDDEEDDDDNNEYIKDGFVVDEGEEVKKAKRDDLEDSDDDEEDDDDDEDESPEAGSSKKRRLKKVRKMRADLDLDEEDLALIQEAHGGGLPDEAKPKAIEKHKEPERVVAKTEAELRKQLFQDDDEDEDALRKEPKQKQKVRVERYDEDDMGGFIEDDIGDQGDILASEHRLAGDSDDRELNEAQLTEASEIFGTDYLEFMQDDDDAIDRDEEELMGKSKYRERGVGVDLGVDSDDDDFSEDDDLFGDEDDEDDDEYGGGTGDSQKAEALRLKREKRKLAAAERRRQSLVTKRNKRKAQLRRAFEPVQLVENFCTDRDDEIRTTDVPERLFEYKVPYYGKVSESEKDFVVSAEQEKQALWIANQIPELASQLTSTSKQSQIVNSIAQALRFLHCDKLEPAFMRLYRKDYICPSVAKHLYNVVDQDGEWDRIVTAKTKVQRLLEQFQILIATGSETNGEEAQQLQQMQQELQGLQAKLEETAKQEAVVKTDLEALGPGDDDDDDDDELFGDAGDATEEKKKERARLKSHLETIQSLLEERGEKVSRLQARLQAAEAQNRALADPGPAAMVRKKTSRGSVWNKDYGAYAESLADGRHILDINAYLNLINEGNEAIRKKELPLMLDDSAASGKKDKRKRSRRFDRDFYRTCVSEGLRAVCYRFLLSPVRAGIKLEDTLTYGQFDYSKTLEVDDNNDNAEGGESLGGPQKWAAPVIPTSSPSEFAAELIGSGELVVLSSAAGGKDDSKEAEDPLRGCRYVAAMELAHEPRIRRNLRDVYRRNAVLTTKPTKKGMEEIDAFHDYYGLHLIRNKHIKDHFPPDKKEMEARKTQLSEAERNELDLELKKRQRQSCLQYLNILKAEQSGYITVHVHLPFIEQPDDWYSMATDRLMTREDQDLACLMDDLKRVYFPVDGDTEDWNNEREKVLQLALSSFLLPQFEGEVRRDLRDAASMEGVSDAADNLRTAAMQGPYRPTAILHTENRFLYPTGNLPIVGVCCSSDGKDATYLASVTERGESNDFLAIPGGTSVNEHKMKEKVILFLLQSRPAAVVVGTSGGFGSRMFHRKMNDIITEAVQRWKNKNIQGEDEDDEAFDARRVALGQLTSHGHYDDVDEDEDWHCNVELVDDNLAQLFGRSVRGKKEFPDHSVNLKCAISIARYARDPLAEYTYAWSVASDAGVFGTEMLYLNIHPMQQLMPKVLLLRQYERTLCDVVAEVGTDINTASSMDHLHGLLMFVPGLGPRKTANLKQTISQQGGAIARRRDLLEKRMLGPIVYNNAVGFLKISEADQLVDQQLHPLDETRLHPDVYLRNNWAVKIAFDALEREDMRSKDSAGIKALRDVMDNSSREVERLFQATKEEWEKHYGPTFNTKDWDPRVNVPSDMWRDKVEELDLNAFANMIEQNGHGRWHSHLEMIKWEFRLPFADPRKPMEPLTGDKLFRLITGETDQSLRPGKEITGKVVRNGDFGSRVKLEGDIPAFIPLRNLSDEHVESADDFVQPGQVVTAVITEVKKDHMTVDMSLRMEDFRKRPSSWERPPSLDPLDDRFDIGAAASLEEDNTKKREAHLEALRVSLGLKTDENAEDGVKKKRLGLVVRRACTHPAFRNAKNDEVMKELKEGGASMVGEALIRPSSKSSDSLAIHWVVREGVIKVIEVFEEDKETEASIGNTLKIKDEVYGSIDELLGRYIAPMNDFVEEMVNHRKFLDATEDDVDDKLMEQKTATPKAIPYFICWMEMHPGFASLRFVGSVTPRSHTVGITPKGFTWGTNTFGSLDRLINEFKRNPRGVAKPKPKEGAKAPPKPPNRGRWGAKPPAPPAPAPPQAWGPRPPPPPMQPATSWQGQPIYAAPGPWGHMPPQGQPMPAQYAYAQPPMYAYAPPPMYAQPPPMYAQPPPPAYRPPPPSAPPPAYGHQQQQQQQQQPPPPFDSQAGAPSQGRGRGRTLPAWMSKG